MAAATEHGAPAEGAECPICFDDITPELYAEFKVGEDGAWEAATVCSTCIAQWRSSAFVRWDTLLRETDCRITLRRMLRTGPPLAITRGAMAGKMVPPKESKEGEEEAEESEDDAPIAALWFNSDGDTSPFLDGAPKDAVEAYMAEAKRMVETKFGDIYAADSV